jgi:6-phosphogluconolactonase (cycloisomerase 2 family)
MSTFIKNGGSWVAPKSISVNNGGVWQESKGVYIKDGSGTWQKVYDPNPTPPPPTDQFVALQDDGGDFQTYALHLAMSADGNYLYSYGYGTIGVLAYKVNSDKTVVPYFQTAYLGTDPADITISADGKYLYVSDVSYNPFKIYSVASDGKITEVSANQDYFPEYFTPDSKFAFSRSINGSVYIMSYNPSNGSLTSINYATSQLQQSYKGEVSYDGSVLTYTDGQHSAAAFIINKSTGALTPGNAVNFGADYVTESAVSKDGSYLYVSISVGGGGYFIYVYSINKTNGNLTFIGKIEQTSTVGSGGINSMTTSRDGSYLYTLHTNSALDVYAINQSSGLLSYYLGVETVTFLFPEEMIVSPDDKGIFAATQQSGSAVVPFRRNY